MVYLYEACFFHPIPNAWAEAMSEKLNQSEKEY